MPLLRGSGSRTSGRPGRSVLVFAGLVWLASFAMPLWGADPIEAGFFFRTGKYAECVDATTELLKDSTFNESLWVLKLRAEMELGRYADALKTLDASLEKHPGSIQLRWIGRDVCRFNGQAERATKLEGQMVELLSQSAWRYTDTANQMVVGRWMLSQRVDPKKVLSGVYKAAQQRQPSSVDVALAMGDLALEKHDYQLASEAFAKAIKIDPEHPDAQFGLAQAFAPSDGEKAEVALQAALKTNPNHIAALLMIVDEHIDSERYADAEVILAKVAEINPSQPLALGYRAVLAHLKNQPEAEKKQHAAALEHYAQNPAVDHLIGRKLSQKYRFAEGAEYQRQALNFDANYLLAKEQLAQDLLRLGKEEEGLKLAEEVYAADAYNVFAHNLVTLQEELAKFRTLEADGLIVRMEAKEAEIYGQQVLDLLQRAKAELCKKYDVKLEQPVIVELFPRQQDFAIRTFGLPGGAGFLGVCFGTVITANSPASQTTSPSCWEATLWHEFCHVVTLNKTKNKMPRWLSEGISVYEEGQADRTWGQTMNPRYREMILGEDLTPVSKLSGAFLSPKSALHLQFAYFESSLVVEYLVQKYGQETLQRVLVDLGAGLPINESLTRYVGSLDALDTEFAEYAKKKALELAPEVDWTPPDLARTAKADAIAAWVKENPKNYAALRRLAQQYIADKKWDEAKVPLEEMRKLYPTDGGAGNPLLLLAQVYRETGENSAERAVLEKVAELSSSDVAALDRLCELTAKAEDWPATAKYAQKRLAINPLFATPHRFAAQAAEKLKDDPLTITSLQALLSLEPYDRSAVHYQLAAALLRTGDVTAAERHALLALEEAPRYRDAQKLLLQIVAKQEPPATPPPADTAPAEKPPADKPAETPAPETKGP